jgi:hypothetical protein
MVIGVTVKIRTGPPGYTSQKLPFTLICKFEVRACFKINLLLWVYVGLL